jgi:adenylate kinase family enzyme
MARCIGVKRVAVVGPGGAGKSTFARELGQRTGIAVIHLDQHYWKPGWVETPREEWRGVHNSLLARDSWIVDGNYGGTFDVRLARADTVIVLAPSRLRCLIGALRRTLRYYGRDVQAAGCPERIDVSFLRWIWRYPRDSRPRLDAALGRHRARLRVIELNSPGQVEDFLQDVGGLEWYTRRRPSEGASRRRLPIDQRTRWKPLPASHLRALRPSKLPASSLSSSRSRTTSSSNTPSARSGVARTSITGSSRVAMQRTTASRSSLGSISTTVAAHGPRRDRPAQPCLSLDRPANVGRSRCSEAGCVERPCSHRAVIDFPVRRGGRERGLECWQ